MISVTSVSGGRTSGYMALHYPTDYNIFSLCRIEDVQCRPWDKKLIQYVEDKIQTPFIATIESDLTLYVLIQLEQDLGKEIVWVTGPTYEQVIRNSNTAGDYLPNRKKRFCTQFMKLDPIFWWCYLNLFENEDDFIEMNIGYRFDEPKRVADDIYKFTKSCKNFGQFFNNWEEIEWRNSAFPLRKHGIDNFIVRSYFANKPEYVFPPTSNCVMCFNHTEIELFDNFVYEPEKMQWAIDQEIRTGNRFNMQISLTDLKNKKYTSEEIRKMVKVEKQFTCNCTE